MPDSTADDMTPVTAPRNASPPPPYTVTTVRSTGPDSNRVDIVFMGDGYTAGEIATTYAAHVQGMVDYLTSGGTLTDPFGRYANFFNIYRVDVVSNQSGADVPPEGVSVDTALNASYFYDGVTDRLLYVDTGLATSVLNQAVSGTTIHPDMKFVSVNSARYGGGGGAFAVFAGANASARELALHEMGHSFAGLADEYGDLPGAYPGGEPGQPNVTIDPTGAAKWARWLGYDQPGLGVVGAYPGGSRYSTGIYHPSPTSKMQALGQPFDAIAREAFVLDFYKIVHPLDSYTSNGAPLVDPATVAAKTIDPAVISTTWSVDGVPVTTVTTESFNPLSYAIPSGDHVLSLRAYDPTDWVRVADRSSLEQNVAWSLHLDYAILQATPGNQTLTGGPLVDEVRGSALADTLSGGAGNDILHGNGGNDVLIGGPGADYMTGDAGADVFRLAAASDSNSAASDFIGDFQSGADKLDLAALGPTGIGIVQSNGGALVFVNSPGGSSLVLSAAAIQGSDVLTGGIGVLIQGDNSSTLLIGSAQNDALHGAAGNDTLIGGGGADALFGEAGFDTFRFLAASDSTAAAPDLVVDFASGTDKIDIASIGATAVSIVDVGGSSFLFATTPTGNLQVGSLATIQGSDVLTAALGVIMVGDQTAADTLLGGPNGDVLVGNGGNDVLAGYAGNDALTGGAAADLLVGGSGADQFRYYQFTDSSFATGVDIIQDFETGIDKIYLGATLGITAVGIAGGYVFASGPGGSLQIAVMGAIALGDIFADSPPPAPAPVSPADISVVDHLGSGMVNHELWIA